MNKTKGLTFIFFLLACSLQAQLSFYKHYTVNNGLPSSVVYDLAQDSAGYLWIATEYGVSRYDGYTFHNYSIENGLPANSNVLMFEGKPGTLWFLSYSGLLSYTSGRYIRAFPLNDSLEALGGRYYSSTLSVDKQNNVWLRYGKDSSKSVRITEKFEVNIVDTTISRRHNFSYIFRAFYKEQFGDMQSNFPEKNVMPKQKLYKTKFGYFYLDQHDHLVYAGNRLVTGTIYQIDSTDTYVEADGKLWLRKKWDGIYLYDLMHYREPPQRFLQNQRVTRILKGRDRNYWIATEGNGLYLVPSVECYVYDKRQGISNDNILSIEVHDNHLLFATNDGKLYTGRLNQLARLQEVNEMIPHESYKYCRDILYDGNDRLWLIATRYLRYTPTGLPLPLNCRVIKKSYEFHECANGDVLVAMIEGYVRYGNNNLKYDSRSDGFAAHVRTIYEDRNGIVWLGAMEGLYSFDGARYKYWGDSLKLLGGRITSVRGMNGYLWVGTRSEGVLVMANDKSMQLSKSYGLSSNMITCIHVQDEHTVWVGTIDGLNRIEAESGMEDFRITHYTVWDGLPSNEINDINSYGDYLILGTNFGLATFQPEQIKIAGPPPLLNIEDFFVNGIRMDDVSDLKLGDSVNSVGIKYTGINFDKPGNLEYSYKIDWFDKNHSPFSASYQGMQEWTYTRNTSLQLNTIPGHYALSIKAGNENQASTIKTLRFSVAKPISQQLWFHILILLIVMAAVSFVFIIILKNRKRKEEIRNSLLLSEQKALRSQMNPHFIFNSLNSIQNFVLERDDEKADLYLANFSSLMRKVLENSKHNLIPLSEELDTLKIYMGLEQLRFENKFDFKIDVDDRITPDSVMIPPSMIQPFVENAIWHGLMPKEGEGLLILKIQLIEETMIKISIEDNGIGREAAARVGKKRRGHKSTGMKNIEERLYLLNRSGKKGFELRIEDLYDDSGQASGTRIELSMPVEQNT